MDVQEVIFDFHFPLEHLFKSLCQFTRGHFLVLAFEDYQRIGRETLELSV